MAESLMPTSVPMVPGMVALLHKKTKSITNHFPVDAKEILSGAPDEYEMVRNGSIEAGRIDVTTFLRSAAPTNQTRSVVTGIEGMVSVSMSDEEHKAFLAFQKNLGGRELPVGGAVNATPDGHISDPKVAADMAKLDDKANAKTAAAK